MITSYRNSSLIPIALICAITLPLYGCGEETYKVQRGTDEVAKPKDSKASTRIENAKKAEEEILQKSKKLR